LAEAIAHERFDRIVVAAAAEGEPGFDADDVAWLLNRAPGEIVVLRTDGHGLSRECETAGSR
jgi:uridylate kinase